MNKSYRMLVGRQFTIGKDPYVVSGFSGHKGMVLVDAIDCYPSPKRPARLQVPLERVLQSLLVDEEIELKQPDFLRA